MVEGIGAPSRVHLSKSILRTWERCRLAYRFERVDRLAVAATPSVAQPRGTAGTAAVASVLESPSTLGETEQRVLVDQVLLA